jgi:hypothetical protein
MPKDEKEHRRRKHFGRPVADRDGDHPIESQDVRQDLDEREHYAPAADAAADAADDRRHDGVMLE